MQPTPENAQLEAVFANSIPGLAVFYDRFANALDPFSPERDRAESLFIQEVASLYDHLRATSSIQLDLHTFRKGVIERCRKHLRATDKISNPFP